MTRVDYLITSFEAQTPMRSGPHAPVEGKDLNKVREDFACPTLILPEGEGSERGVAIALLALAGALFWAFRRYGVVANEGIILEGAQHVLDGQVPYRDFFALFTPGSFYFHALLFKVFGDSIVVARSAEAVQGALLAVLTYLITRRVCSRWSSLLAAYLVVVATLSFGLYAIHNWDSTMWACLTVYFGIWMIQRPHWRWVLVAGTCCSLTGLFEQSKGAGLLLGLAVGFGILIAAGRFRLKRSWVFAAAAGLAWPVVVLLAYLASQHALPQMVADMLHPLRHYAAVNVVPYGYMNWSESTRAGILSGSYLEAALVLLAAGSPFLISALPIFGVGILAYSAVQVWRARERTSEIWPYYVLVSACTSGLLLSVLLTRKDWSHFIFIAPMVSPILAWLLDGKCIRLRLMDPAKPIIVLLLLASLSFLGVGRLLKIRGYVARSSRRGVLMLAPPENAMSYLRNHVKPGERILVYPYFPLYYYLTEAANPTAHDFLQPGYNDPEEFRHVLDVIASVRPRVILFQPSFYDDLPLTAPSTPIAILAARDPVEEYILGAYRPCTALAGNNLGGLVFMVRKGVPCPEPPGSGNSHLQNPGAADQRFDAQGQATTASGNGPDGDVSTD